MFNRKYLAWAVGIFALIAWSQRDPPTTSAVFSASSSDLDSYLTNDPAVLKALYPSENATMRAICRLPPRQVKLPDTAPSSPTFDRRINKLFNVEDFRDERIVRWADALGLPGYRFVVWRKIWEWGLGLYALDKFHMLQKDKIGIGLASGHEHPIYYLSHRLKHVYATDIYGEGSFSTDGTASDEVFANFGKFSPLKEWNKAAVTVMKMDARNLSRFQDSYADFIFSFSSIEHFPAWGTSGEPHTGASQSMQEQGRVLKSGGIAIVATEVIVNGRDECDWPDFFTPNEFQRFIVEPARVAGLHLVEEIDWTLSSLTREATLNIDDSRCYFYYPHALLRGQHGKCVFGSVMAVFQKK
jgi:SAM-dependent methyltransferase